MYGKVIPGLTIEGKSASYPVINEREVRGAAGIMFFIGLVSFVYVFVTRSYTPLYIVVPLFWIDFFIKSIFQPHWSPFGFIARFIVRKQKPEYVGAIQKRFAWSIGLFLATIMLIGPIGFGIRGMLPLTICLVCIFFMWLESSFGICLGCNIYTFLIRIGVLDEPDVRPACPGGVCRIHKK